LKQFSFRLSLFAGIAVGAGCLVNLSCDNRYMGALLFTVGLFFILTTGSQLFTGVCAFSGYRLLPILGGNLLGIVLITLPSGLWNPALAQKALAAWEKPLSMGWPLYLVNGLCCGMMMYLAVRTWRKYQEKQPLFAFAGLMFAIPCFILSGFVHCIALWGYGVLAVGAFPDALSALRHLGLGLLTLVPIIASNFLGSRLTRLLIDPTPAV